MTYRVTGLNPAKFRPLFALADQELPRAGILRRRAAAGFRHAGALARGFDSDGMMADALLAQPGEADAAIRTLFASLISPIFTPTMPRGGAFQRGSSDADDS